MFGYAMCTSKKQAKTWITSLTLLKISTIFTVSDYSLMTKKEKILKVGLKLFANYGFHGTSTAQIAKEAGVSEGLIFKHFISKKGLLESIFSSVGDRLTRIYQEMIAEDHPITVIRMFIEIPFNIDSTEHVFWRLIFKLKWDQDFYNPEEKKPIIKKLAWAFKELGYVQPKLEAEVLYQNIESISINILRDGKNSQLKLKKFLLDKFKAE